MQKRHSDSAQYFNEQTVTSEKYYIPYIEQFIPDLSGLRVLEIGCGDGGNILPFLQRGCEVTALDLSEKRIQQAKFFLTQAGFTPKLLAADFFQLNLSELGKFDLILMHDVIEHMHEKEKLLTAVQSLLTERGIFFIGFPAWYMPFGGHQQICRNKLLSVLPFYHILPAGLYRSLLKMGGENKEVVDELLDIKECKTSIELFERLIRQVNYQVLNRQLYFINPHYEIKFNLKPRKLAPFLGKIRGVRNLFSTSCFYLLTSATPPGTCK